MVVQQAELWQQEARKLGGESLVQVITDIREDQIKILKRLDTMDARHKESEDSISRLFASFPDGDTEGHRRYHQVQIEKLNEIRRLRVAIQEKTISGLLWSSIVLVALAVWDYVKLRVRGM